MTPPVFALHPEPGAELDLDSPTADVARLRRRWRGPLAVAVAVVLLGAGTGAALRTITAAAPPPALPQGELSFVGAYLDGETIATLRLTLHNSSPTPVDVRSFDLDGVRTDHISQPLDRTVPARGTTAILVPVAADCSRTLIFTPLRAQAHLADGTVVTAVPARELASAGGLCRQLRAALPDGWWDPWDGVTVRPAGDDLEVTLPPLEPGASLAGMWVGPQILTYRTPPQPLGNSYRPIQIERPRECVLDGQDRMPTGLRILLTGKGGLRNRYVVIGPDLARWLMRGC